MAPGSCARFGNEYHDDDEALIYACADAMREEYIPMGIVDLMLEINAGAYSFEAAHVRHEHEWKLSQDVRLAEGKNILPGVVSHSTNVVEHPELVAERIGALPPAGVPRTSSPPPTVAWAVRALSSTDTAANVIDQPPTVVIDAHGRRS